MTRPFNDYAINLCNGIASGTTTVSIGRLGQAIFNRNACQKGVSVIYRFGSHSGSIRILS